MNFVLCQVMSNLVGHYVHYQIPLILNNHWTGLEKHSLHEEREQAHCEVLEQNSHCQMKEEHILCEKMMENVLSMMKMENILLVA